LDALFYRDTVINRLKGMDSVQLEIMFPRAEVGTQDDYLVSAQRIGVKEIPWLLDFYGERAIPSGRHVDARWSGNCLQGRTPIALPLRRRPGRPAEVVDAAQQHLIADRIGARHLVPAMGNGLIGS
jgi:hypothetical protein